MTSAGTYTSTTTPSTSASSQPRILIDPSNLDSATALLGASTPIHMLNLLHFRSTASYPPSSPSLSLPPTTGQSAYMTRYVPAFNAIAARVSSSIKPTFIGGPVASIIGENDGTGWDVIALISYPSITAFREVVESEEYKTEAEGHRLAALEGWKLYAVKELRL